MNAESTVSLITFSLPHWSLFECETRAQFTKSPIGGLLHSKSLPPFIWMNKWFNVTIDIHKKITLLLLFTCFPECCKNYFHDLGWSWTKPYNMWQKQGMEWGRGYQKTSVTLCWLFEGIHRTICHFPVNQEKIKLEKYRITNSKRMKIKAGSWF